MRRPADKSGWVLTRRLRMAIPDDVAQYAEGHRIVSYFSLGKVQDGDQPKDIWLWTTVGDGARPYDFDSFRVFVWSVRRHRYETEYIERESDWLFARWSCEPVHVLRRQGEEVRPEQDLARILGLRTEKGRPALPASNLPCMNTLIRFAGRGALRITAAGGFRELPEPRRQRPPP